ncbi:DUF1499 domain-containing protein [Aquabacterium fontiphilum]|uniref:DUF1499 domain-containing protein n=1 Tax=Aquabacterium fontiphilum TaxID=450365 RepID=UPI001377E9DC|nr:DUF1499 domain-containing protein [Aquabacterium fontiphilum]NBD21164.1 DUF1499 domain-containing protein [Aquabacterium fontiphilum]
MAVTAALALLMAAAVGTQLGMLAGEPPADLGVRDGRLKPPSETRNSVSSQARLLPQHPQHAYAQVDPFPMKPAGPQASWQALRTVLTRTPGVRIVADQGDYLRAEAQTPWMKFVDDLEFWLNREEAVIEVRSASRLGREDFGKNRQRVEALRAAYLAQPSPP